MSALIAFPMHGEGKLRTEGLRTRDAHLLEWHMRLTAKPVTIVSRPEPWPRVTWARRTARDQRLEALKTATWITQQVSPLRAIPSSHAAWWLWASRAMALPVETGHWLVWNPLMALNEAWPDFKGRVLFDMLDDWLTHYAFRAIQREIERAYSVMFERAEAITCNSEATYARALAFGRSDAQLLLNGCDPQRFSSTSTATGCLTVGYAGKLGRRLDVPLVLETAAALPHVRFVFAGPTLERESVKDMKDVKNLHLIGDIPYDRYPALLQEWDVAWVPHSVGENEVGGDVLKIYEFRAAGLPTFSTPVLGSHRALEGVRYIDRRSMPTALSNFLSGPYERVPREPTIIPSEHTWREKAGVQQSLLALPGF